MLLNKTLLTTTYLCMNLLLFNKANNNHLQIMYKYNEEPKHHLASSRENVKIMPSYRRPLRPRRIHPPPQRWHPGTVGTRKQDRSCWIQPL